MGYFRLDDLADEKNVCIITRNLISAVHFAQDKLQPLNMLEVSGLDEGNTGDTALLNSIEEFLVVTDVAGFFSRQSRSKRKSRLNSLGRFCRKIAEPGRTFPIAANRISAFLSCLILGSHGYTYDVSNNDVREYIPAGRRNISTTEQGFFFDRWETKITSGIGEGHVDEWFSDWSLEFAPWLESNDKIAITGNAKQRESFDKEFDLLIKEQWNADWQIRRLAFIPVLIWAERYDWFHELCHCLKVTSFEY